MEAQKIEKEKSMKKCIVFTDEELNDMLNGREVRLRMSDNVVLYFMSKNRYSKYINETAPTKNKGEKK